MQWLGIACEGEIAQVVGQLLEDEQATCKLLYNHFHSGFIWSGVGGFNEFE